MEKTQQYSALRRFVTKRSIAYVVTMSTLPILLIVEVVVYSFSTAYDRPNIEFGLSIGAILVIMIAPVTLYLFLNMFRRLHASELKLTQAMAEVRDLQKLIPLCASCGKARDDQGYWKQLDHYIQQHTDVQITHGICPDCKEQTMREFYEESDQAD